MIDKKKANFNNYSYFILGLFLFILSSYLLIKKPFNYIFLILNIFSFLLIFIYFFKLKSSYEKSILYEYNIKNDLIKFFIGFVFIILGIFLFNKKLYFISYLLWFIALLFYITIDYIKVKSYEIEQISTTSIKNFYIRFFLYFLLVFFVFLFRNNLILTFIFLILASFIVSLNFKNFKIISDDNEFARIDKIFMLIILSIAIFLRFFKLEDIPPGYTYDVRRVFDIVMQIKNGTKFGVFISDIDVSSASLLFYEIFYFLKFFGYKLVNIRIFMILHSLISLPIFYLLVKELYNKKIALFSSIIFYLSFIFVLYSRLDNGLYLAILFILLSNYFLIKGIKTGKIYFYVLSSIFTALNMYTYHAAKVNLFISIFIFLIYFFNKSQMQNFKFNLLIFAIWVLSFLIIFWPLFVFIIKDFNVFTQRAIGITPEYKTGIIKFFYNNFKDIIFSFIYIGSNYEYVNLPFRPIFIGLEAILFIAGLTYLVSGIGQKNNLMLFFWLLISILPEIFFYHHSNPYYFRMILSFPALAIIAGLGIYVFYFYLENLFSKFKKGIYYFLITMLTINITYVTYKDYFIKYANAPIIKEQFDYVNKKIQDMVLKYNKDYKIFISNFFLNRPMFCGECFFNKNVEIKNISKLKFNDFNLNNNLMIIAEGIYLEYFNYLKEFFPNMQIEKVYNEDGLKYWIDPIFNEYLYIIAKIPIDDLYNVYGLRGEFYINDKKIKEEIIKNEIILDEKVEKVILKGLIEIPITDKYEILLNNKNMKYEIIIDNKVYNNYFELIEGLHKIKIKIDLSKSYSNLNKVKIIVKNAKKEIAPIFLNKESIYGLNAYYKTDISNIKTYKIDSILHIRINWYDPQINIKQGEEYFDIIWNGYFFVEEDGNYSFRLFTPDEFCNIIKINNIEFINTNESIKSVYLKKGWNKIEIKSYARIIQSIAGAYFILKIKKDNDEIYKPVEYYKLKPFL